jgi:hypothetical protein
MVFDVKMRTKHFWNMEMVLISHAALMESTILAVHHHSNVTCMHSLVIAVPIALQMVTNKQLCKYKHMSAESIAQCADANAYWSPCATDGCVETCANQLAMKVCMQNCFSSDVASRGRCLCRKGYAQDVNGVCIDVNHCPWMRLTLIWYSWLFLIINSTNADTGDCLFEYIWVDMFCIQCMHECQVKTIYYCLFLRAWTTTGACANEKWTAQCNNWSNNGF